MTNKTDNKIDINTPEVITGSVGLVQDAIFRIGVGWTGGMGSFPIFAEGGDGPKQISGSPLYLDDADAEKILKDYKLPGCYVGQPVIKIFAQINIEKMSGINHSIPPDDNGKQPTENYNLAKILNLYDAFIQAEPCKE
jgi:hypothetical protein